MDDNLKRMQELIPASELEQIIRFERDQYRDLQYRPSAERQVDYMRGIMQSMTSAPQVAAENIQEAIRQHITACQSGLGNDEQLVVYSTSGLEIIIVENIGFPNWHTVILVGKDKDKNVASVVASVTEIHLTCKVMKVVPPNKAYRVGFIQAAKV